MAAESIRPADDWRDRDILGDIEAGDRPFPLTQLPHQAFAPRDERGRAFSVQWAFRLRDRKGLETQDINGRQFTTMGSFLRLLAKDSGAARTVGKARGRRRALASAERSLSAEGI